MGFVLEDLPAYAFLMDMLLNFNTSFYKDGNHKFNNNLYYSSNNLWNHKNKGGNLEKKRS